MIGNLRYRLFNTLNQLASPMWLLEGIEKNSKMPLSVAYAGINRHKNYFSRLVFEASPKETFYGKHPVWSLKRRLQGLNADLRVAEINSLRVKFYAAPQSPRIPLWVWTKCDLNGGREMFETSRRYRTHRQRVRQHELLRYRLYTEKSALKDFYENMYLPYADHRHADSTFTYSYDEVETKFMAGQLGGLEQDGVPIVSQVTAFNGKTAHAFVMGVRKGHEDLLRKGILEVLNYFTLIQLAEKGFNCMDIGYSRGFLQDGVLQNKFRMGARLSGNIHEESGYLVYDVARWTEAAQSFLVHNPVVLSEEGKLWAGYFEGREQLPADELRRRAEDLRGDGFEGVRIIRHSPVSGRLETSAL
jgi:hypothetical protein